VVLGYLSLNKLILKTTNSGINWNTIYSSSADNMLDIYFVNRDTGWACGWDFNNPKIWRTTDGGNTFNLQYSPGGYSYFTKIFFLKNEVNNEYYGWSVEGSSSLFRTTNSGVNWTLIYTASVCSEITDYYFKDSVNGVMTCAMYCIMVTTNGGYNWTIFSESAIGTLARIGIANDNVGWITGFPDTVFKTTNFFQTYGKQYHPVIEPGKIFAVDTSYAFTASYLFARTTNGGGPIAGIEQINNKIPGSFSLSQNYPNPFNPQTNIEFSLPEQSRVTLIIYDILGREVYKELESRNLTAGSYKITLDFDRLGISGGIYFYRLEVFNLKDNQIYKSTKKLIYLK
jgi:hypothetical protein